MLEALEQTLSRIDQTGPTKGYVEAAYADQFNDALGLLQAAGEDVSQYPMTAHHNLPPGSRIVDAGLVLTNVRAVLGYFRVRDAVLSQAAETGESVRCLMGFETPPRPRE
jgi:hypothetical protein